MRVEACACSLLLSSWLGGGALAADPPVAPGESAAPPRETTLDVGKVERERVRLVLVDVVVVDREGRTVADLGPQDFEVVTAGEALDVATLDLACPAGPADEPRGMQDASLRELPATSPASIVLAVDYQHLGQLQRAEVLGHARRMIQAEGAEGERLMVAALTGGLRIEQPFTTDREAVLRTLQRMQYDISLWNGNFGHMSEGGFVGGVTALLDVLETEPGSKSVVLFSAMGDVPLDLQFAEIAAVAASSRCAVYPVDARGLTAELPPAAAPGLGSDPGLEQWSLRPG